MRQSCGVLALLLMLAIGCSAASWKKLGPPHGYVASIAFNPSDVNEVWLSGDDGNGLYCSKEGGKTFQQVPAVPYDWSSYAVKVEPECC